VENNRQILKRKQVTFIIGDNTVNMKYKDQVVSFNCYDKQSHKRFNKFKTEVVNSNKNDLCYITDAFALARKYGVSSMGSYKSTIVRKRIAF